jgi:uncharacterized protein
MKNKPLVRTLLAYLDAYPPEDHTDILDLPPDIVDRELVAAGLSRQIPKSIRDLISKGTQSQPAPSGLEAVKADAIGDPTVNRPEDVSAREVDLAEARKTMGRTRFRTSWNVWAAVSAIGALAASVVFLVMHQIELQYEVRTLQSSLVAETYARIALVSQLSDLKKELQATLASEYEASQRETLSSIDAQIANARKDLLASLSELKHDDDKLQRNYATALAILSASRPADSLFYPWSVETTDSNLNPFSSTSGWSGSRNVSLQYNTQWPGQALSGSYIGTYLGTLHSTNVGSWTFHDGAISFGDLPPKTTLFGVNSHPAIYEFGDHDYAGVDLSTVYGGVHFSPNKN